MKNTKNKKNESVVRELILSATEKDLLVMTLSYPGILYRLCILMSLEDQLVRENKINSKYNVEL
jgi:hypothetical protein